MRTRSKKCVMKFFERNEFFFIFEIFQNNAKLEIIVIYLKSIFPQMASLGLQINVFIYFYDDAIRQNIDLKFITIICNFEL
jgi:hypothetical protein